MADSPLPSSTRIPGAHRPRPDSQASRLVATPVKLAFSPAASATWRAITSAARLSLSFRVRPSTVASGADCTLASSADAVDARAGAMPVTVMPAAFSRLANAVAAVRAGAGSACQRLNRPSPINSGLTRATQERHFAFQAGLKSGPEKSEVS